VLSKFIPGKLGKHGGHEGPETHGEHEDPETLVELDDFDCHR
jgi:hypothetical protein